MTSPHDWMPNQPSRRPMRCAALLVLAALISCASALAQDDPQRFPEALSRARVEMRAARVTEGTRLFNLAADLADTNDARAQAWYELSRELEARRLYEEATRPLAAIVALDPPSAVHAPALQRLAAIHMRLKQYAEAAAVYERLAQFPEANAWMVESALWGQARAWQEAGEMAKAAEAAGELLRRLPESRFSGQAAAVLVEERLSAGDVSTAREIAEAEASRQNGNAGLLLRVAARLQADGDVAGAAEMLEALVGRQPDNATGMKLLYELHRDAGDLAEYETALKQRIKAKPDDPAPGLRLADLYEREQRPKQALATLEELVQARPEDADLVRRIAEAAVKAGELEAAVEYLKRALELSPENLRLRTDLGDVYARMGQRDQAVTEWKLASRYDAHNLAAARMLGAQLLAHGFYQDAVDVYLEARKVTGDATVLAAELGQAYEALLRIEEAVQEYVAAMEDPMAAGLAEYRLQALASDQVVGPEVIAALERCAEQAALPPPAQVALGVAYLKAQRAEDAMRLLGGLPASEMSARALVQAGEVIRDQGDTLSAIALYEAALGQEQRPTQVARLAGHVADLCIGQGLWMRARQALARALELQLPEPLAEQLRLRLADANLVWGGDLAEARKLYEHVIAFSANDDNKLLAQWGLADCAFAEGKYAEAARDYRQLGEVSEDMETPPPPPPTLHVIAPEFGLVGFGPPRRPMGPDWALLRLAEISFRKGDMKQAVKLFEQVASRYAQSPYANDALSRQLLITSEFTGGSPAEGKYLQALGLLDRGEFEPAFRALSMIATLGPDEPLADDAAWAHAEALRCLERFGEARDQFARLAEKFPDSPYAAQALLAAATLQAREPEGRDEAIRLLRQLIALAPDGPEAAEAQRSLEELTRR